LIPGLDAAYRLLDWSPDGTSIYVTLSRSQGTPRVRLVSRANVVTGKIEPWKEFGLPDEPGVTSMSRLIFSKDGAAHAYIYVRNISQAYVVKGLQ